jgi:hypothetical protein
MCSSFLALILVASIALITAVNLCIILGGRDTMELEYIWVNYTAMVGCLISRCHNYHQSASIRVTPWNKFRNVPPVCCLPVMEIAILGPCQLVRRDMQNYQVQCAGATLAVVILLSTAVWRWRFCCVHGIFAHYCEISVKTCQKNEL